MRKKTRLPRGQSAVADEGARVHVARDDPRQVTASVRRHARSERVTRHHIARDEASAWHRHARSRACDREPGYARTEVDREQRDEVVHFEVHGVADDLGL